MPFLSYARSELLYSLMVDPKLPLTALDLHFLSIPFHPGCVSETAKKGSLFKGCCGHGKKGGVLKISLLKGHSFQQTKVHHLRDANRYLKIGQTRHPIPTPTESKEYIQ